MTIVVEQELEVDGEVSGYVTRRATGRGRILRKEDGRVLFEGSMHVPAAREIVTQALDREEFR